MVQNKYITFKTIATHPIALLNFLQTNNSKKVITHTPATKGVKSPNHNKARK